MSVTKPPLGVIPRVLWEFMCDNYRKDSLFEAMRRYALVDGANTGRMVRRI